MTPGLTDEDRAKLADMATNGVLPYTNSSRAPAPTPTETVTCHLCGYRWPYTGDALRATCPCCDRKTPRDDAPKREDGRGLTTPMCNAIREAAADGHPYREIARLFTFVNDGTAVHRHATGRCSHAGNRPPVEPARDPGVPNAVDAAECADLRARYAAGESVPALSDATGRATSTVWRHVGEECSHGGGG